MSRADHYSSKLSKKTTIKLFKYFRMSKKIEGKLMQDLVFRFSN